MSKIKTGTTLTTAYVVEGDTTGSLVIQTGATPTTAMTIDASQNIGIGTSSPTRKLDVAGTWSNTGDYLMNSTSPQLAWASGDLRFYAGGLAGTGTQQAVITATGNFQMNSGYGSVATAYGCRAWVNFNGTGTVAIRGSGNVSSITDSGVGKYVVNFSTALPDANYGIATSGSLNGNSGTSPGQIGTSVNASNNAYNNKTTSACDIWVVSVTAAFLDPFEVDVSIFR